MGLNKLKKTGILLLAAVFSLVAWVPLLFLCGGSLMGLLELKETLGPVLLDTKGYATWHWLPYYPTVRPYVELLLDNPGFFVQFWNSIKLTALSVGGQMLVAAPAAWWFARNHTRWGGKLFSLYMVLMLMPFQVTLVSHYLVVDKLGLLNRHGSIILPAIFSTFPVFIMYRFFRSIPGTVLEAAAIDGANQWQIFTRIGIPSGAAGVMAALVLAFLELWNLIEQPMIFLKDKSLWPLSLFLPEISTKNLSLAFAASVVTLIPALLVFLFGQEYLEQGIAHSGGKE